jgi:hypothetical protein
MEAPEVSLLYFVWTEKKEGMVRKGGLEPPLFNHPKLRRSAGVSEARTRCRNPERSRGISNKNPGAKGGTRTPTPYGARS